MDNQIDQTKETVEEVPDMKSMVECLNRMVLDGYSEDFKVIDIGLKSLKSEKLYSAEEVSVVNFFRFEGQSDPEDNSILYVIETMDGGKGTLVDAYGPYADAKVTGFMKNVEDIQKKTTKKED